MGIFDSDTAASALSYGTTGAAIGGPPGAAGGAVVGVVLDQWKKAEAKGDVNEMARIARENYEALKNVQIPSLQDMIYKAVPEKRVELMEIRQQQNSEFANIQANPLYKQAKLEVLQAYDDRIEGGGMTAMDKLNYDKAIQAADLQATQRQGDVQLDMARRGISGGGQEQLAQLMAGQQSANRAGEAGREMNAVAQQRALEAIMGKGNMAGNYSNEDVRRQEAAATSQDAINRYNTGLAVNTEISNKTYERDYEREKARAETKAAEHKANQAAIRTQLEMNKFKGGTTASTPNSTRVDDTFKDIQGSVEALAPVVSKYFGQKEDPNLYKGQEFQPMPANGPVGGK